MKSGILIDYWLNYFTVYKKTGERIKDLHNLVDGIGQLFVFLKFVECYKNKKWILNINILIVILYMGVYRIAIGTVLSTYSYRCNHNLSGGYVKV